MNATTNTIKFYGKIEEFSFPKHIVYAVGVEGSEKRFAINFFSRTHYQDGQYSSSAWIIEEIVDGVEPFRSFKHKSFKHHTSKTIPAKMQAWIKANS